MTAEERARHEGALVDAEAPEVVAELARLVCEAIRNGRDLAIRIDSHGWYVATRIGPAPWYAIPLSDTARMRRHSWELRGLA